MAERIIDRILVLNPGSTSTKLAIYENENCLVERTLDIPAEQVNGCKTVFDQYDLRMGSIEAFLTEAGIAGETLSCIAARGCGGGNQKAGAYLIDDNYIRLCKTNGVPHISNLGPILALELGRRYGIPAYVYDAEGVNERDPLTLVSGLKELHMNAGSHVLNAKMVARKAAERIKKSYDSCIIIVCHMGGGISSSVHWNGKLIDSTYDAFAPERAGGIPASAALNFVHMCFSGEYTEADVKKLLMGKGGLLSYLGTSDLREVEHRIDSGDTDAKFYFDAMVLGLAKDIAAVSATVNMEVDAIALTGGMANSRRLCTAIAERVHKIAPVLFFPGSYEMESLAMGALRVLRGEEEYRLYETDETKIRRDCDGH